MARPSDIVFLVDEHVDARRLNTVKQAVKYVAQRLPSIHRVAIVSYSAEAGTRLVVDFTNDSGDLCYEADKIHCVFGNESGGQRDALHQIASPFLLTWRTRESSDGVVFHFPSCAPSSHYRPLMSNDFSLDWIALSRSMLNARVVVNSFIAPESTTRCLTYHGAMACISRGRLFYFSKSGADLAFQVSRIIDGRTASLLPCHGFSAESDEAFHRMGTEDRVEEAVPRHGSQPPLGPMEGLLRTDACNSRSVSSPEMFACRLRISGRNMFRGWNSFPEDEASVTDCISSSTLTELVREFIESPLPESIGDMFKAVSAVVVGYPIHVPFHSKTGKYNYQCSYGARVYAVRSGTTVSYSEFFNYYTWKLGSTSTRADLSRGVDDFILRDQGKITGVLPVAIRGSRLSCEIFKELSRGPWLDSIAWHSLCRHALPPPNAAAGMLACALWSAIGDGESNTLLDIVHSVLLLKRPAAHVNVNGARAAANVCFDRRWTDAHLTGFTKSLSRALPKISDDRDLFGAGEGIQLPVPYERIKGECVFRANTLSKALGIPPPKWSDEKLGAFVLRAVGKSTYSQPLVPSELGDRVPLLPKPGSRKFNKQMSALVAWHRREGGMCITGEENEKYTISRKDVGTLDMPGCRIVDAYGDATYEYTQERWAPIKLGEHDIEVTVRSGRPVYRWPQGMQQMSVFHSVCTDVLPESTSDSAEPGHSTDFL